MLPCWSVQKKKSELIARLILLPAAMIALGAQARFTTDIAGDVTYANGGPADTAEVVISGGASWVRRTLSDSRGRFRLSGIGAGDFYLSINKVGYYLDTPDERGIPLALKAGAPSTQLHLILKPGGVITGKIVDWEDHPAIGVSVSLRKVREKQAETKSSLRLFHSTATTDDRGIYRAHSLPAGKYLVAIGANKFGNFSESVWQNVPPLFYKDSPDEATATEVSVEGGGEVANVDFAIPNDIGYAIEGRLELGNGFPVSNAFLTLESQTGTTIHSSLQTGENGSFRFEGMRDGKYVLRSYSAILSKYVPLKYAIEVHGADVLGVIIRLSAGAFLSVRIEKTVKAEAAGPVAVSLALVELSTSDRTSAVPVGSRGEAVFRSVPEGRYAPRIEWADDRWYLLQIRHGQSEPGLNPIDLAEGQVLNDVRFVVSDRAASLGGKLNPPASPAGASWWVILVLLDDEPRTSIANDVFMARASEEGSVHFGNLPPGRYKWVLRTFEPDFKKESLSPDQVSDLRSDARECPDSLNLKRSERRKDFVFQPCAVGAQASCLLFPAHLRGEKERLSLLPTAAAK